MIRTGPHEFPNTHLSNQNGSPSSSSASADGDHGLEMRDSGPGDNYRHGEDMARAPPRRAIKEGAKLITSMASTFIRSQLPGLPALQRVDISMAATPSSLPSLIEG